jgi:nucleoside-diphosphate-sugar epimerase
MKTLLNGIATLNLLLLGGAGYIGSEIVAMLRYYGYGVTVVDRFLFSQPHDLPANVRAISADNRELTVTAFKDIDAVLDLAAISNDPAGELNPTLTHEINHQARVHLAHLARLAGAKRYLLFSSCSVYGACDTDVDETLPLNPLTSYATCNVLAERDLLAMNDSEFSVTSFRLATVFGPSRNMRFDLVVNTMTRDAFRQGCVKVNGGGRQYRPLVHVQDVASATLRFLEMSTSMIAGEVFNIGGTNMRMLEVARAIIANVGFEVRIQNDQTVVDDRDYRVSFAKAEQKLGFRADRTVESGAREVLEGLAAGTLNEGPGSIRLNGYREFLTAHDDRVFATDAL